MKTKTKFVRDLAAGREGERRAAEVLGAAGLKCEPNEARGDLAGWDLEFWLAPKVRRVEVKFDLFEAKSGNVAVEYYNPRAARPSGILATTSDLWVVVLADRSVWACRTADLRRYFDTQPCLRDIACGGDGNAAMRLYPRVDLFGKLFVRLDTLPPAVCLTAVIGLIHGIDSN